MKLGGALAVGLVVCLASFGSCSDSKSSEDRCVDAADRVACRRGGGPAYPKGHTCGLILVSEAEEALGESLGSPGFAPAGGLCFNETASGGSFRFAYLAGDSGGRLFDEAVSGSGEVVEGVGEAARWLGDTRRLHVRVAEEGYLWVEVPPVSDPRGVAIELARVALARVG